MKNRVSFLTQSHRAHIVFFYLLCVLVACRPSRERLARQCRDLFPQRSDTTVVLRDSVHYDTIFTASPPKVFKYRDTFCLGDSSRIVTKEIVVDCPPCPAVRVEKRFEIREKYIHLEDTIAVFLAEQARDSVQLQQHKAEQAAFRSSRWANNWRIIALSGWSMVLILLLFSYWIWRKK